MPNTFERPKTPESKKQSSDNDKNKKKISRRELLAGIGGAFMGSYAAGKAAESLGSRKEQSEDANVVDIEGENGSYRVVHSNHHIPNTPSTAHNADALLLEQQMIFSKAGGRMHLDLIATSDEKEAGQYREILQVAREKNIPIFFVDSSMFIKYQELSNERIRSAVIAQLQSLLGLTLIGHDAAKLHSERKQGQLSRRQFMQHGIKATVATYLLMPHAEMTAGWAASQGYTKNNDEKSLARKASRKIQTLNETISPQTSKPLTLDMRNSIMAQKSETVSSFLTHELGRRPTSSLYVGAKHIGVEQELQSTEDARVKNIAKYLDSDEMKVNGKIVRIDFVNNEDGTEGVDISILEDEAFGR